MLGSGTGFAVQMSSAGRRLGSALYQNRFATCVSDREPRHRCSSAPSPRQHFYGGWKVTFRIADHPGCMVCRRITSRRDPAANLATVAIWSSFRR
jgi:hypothetical protein